jgi:iron complex transport system substrate-binding protein
LALTLVLLLAVACGGGDTAADVGDGGETATAAGTYTDDLGRTVTLETTPERVVALSPSGVETLFAVGVTPAGRPESATYPEEAMAVESFGTSYQPNLERIAAMSPDLILADATIHREIIPQLEQLGAPVFAVKFGSVDGVLAALRTVGELTGRTEEGRAAAADIEERVAAVTADTPETPPTVIAVIAAGPEQYFAAKPSSYVGSIIERLGARNLVAEDEPVGRVAGYTALSQERLVQADPDVLILINPVPGAPPLSQTLAGNPAWSGLRAFREGRVLDGDPEVYVQSAGPRVVEAIDELSGLFYPEGR